MQIIILCVIIIFCSNNLNAENYAFLISAGGTTKDSVEENCEYWYDLFLAYEDLIYKEGYDHENVIVFYGFGKDWDSTPPFGTIYERYKKTLHPDWQHNIVDYNNHINTMDSVFKHYSDSVVTNYDNVLIRWVVGHGESFDDADSYRAQIRNWGSSGVYIYENEIIVSDKDLKYSVYPNPILESTNINIELNNNQEIGIEIVNNYGNTVSIIIKDQYLKKGNYTFFWESKGFPQGMYYCVIKNKTKKYINKIIVLK